MESAPLLVNRRTNEVSYLSMSFRIPEMKDFNRWKTQFWPRTLKLSKKKYKICYNKHFLQTHFFIAFFFTCGMREISRIGTKCSSRGSYITIAIERYLLRLDEPLLLRSDRNFFWRERFRVVKLWHHETRREFFLDIVETFKVGTWWRWTIKSASFHHKYI